MPSLFPTFTEYCYIDNMIRAKRNKPLRKKTTHVIRYPFHLLGLLIICSAVVTIIPRVPLTRSNSVTNYRTSPKYRKVIKEGIIFDTVEYHER